MFNSKNERLGGYQLRESIGEGAFGMVRKSIHIQTAHTVAMKIIKREVMCSVAGNGSNQFQNELLIWETLSHPHIIFLLHIFETFHEFGIVTEFAPLGDLKKLIKEGNPVALSISAFLFAQVALAVAYLHKRDLCHRDIKADNVLMFSYNHCKLCDFGFCTESRKNKQQTKFCGTVTYLAPEILRTYDETTGKCLYDGKQTDVWALGVLLYLIISKELPFIGHSQDQIEENILNGCYLELEKVPPNVNSLLKRMLCGNPTTRCTSEEVLDDEWLKETTKWPMLETCEGDVIERSLAKAKKGMREIGKEYNDADNHNVRSEEGGVLRIGMTEHLNQTLNLMIDEFVINNMTPEFNEKKETSVFKKIKKRLSRKSYE